MDYTELQKLRENAHKLRNNGQNEISLDNYFNLLALAEKQQKENVELKVRNLINELKLMDIEMPEWRHYCQKEIEQLKQLLSQKGIL